MYLTDRQIKARLETLEFSVPSDFEPFDIDAQIQPCSIDLRLGKKFWFQRGKKKELDLRRSKLLEVNPRKHWTEKILAPGECIKLRPGQLVLAQTLELFEIPKDCAAKIEGRSSFGRLGLFIHCSADFINPGYRGRMALQLFNASKTTLRLYPGMPVSQLILVNLQEEPERSYGVPSLQSKYLDDDGGPSYWWRDRLVRRLLEQLQEKDYSLSAQDEIVKLIGGVEVEVIDRFEKFVENRKSIEVDNVETVIHEFAKSENGARIRHLLLTRSALGGLVVLLGASISVLFVQPFTAAHWVVWALTVVLAIAAAWALSLQESQWLTTSRLAQLKSRLQESERKKIY